MNEKINACGHGTRDFMMIYPDAFEQQIYVCL